MHPVTSHLSLGEKDFLFNLKTKVEFMPFHSIDFNINVLENLVSVPKRTLNMFTSTVSFWIETSNAQ